ncbi:MAG TPA: hypothetical protein VGF15_06700 [Solirubrobacteraceae bacterium]|jgi:hypothetical protein
MTSFFIAGVDSGAARTEAAYRELRERSEIEIGCPAKARRIFKLSCRIDGHDCEIEVGRPLPHRSGVVTAILDHGREEPFVVHTLGDLEADVVDQVRVGRPVYSVTEFS